MNIVFVDFDGVLNTEKYVRENGNTGLIIDPERVKLLKRIVDATDAKIVLSTSWREHWSAVYEECKELGHEINDIFRKQGLEIYSKTPEISGRREKKILKWIEDIGIEVNYVVLDDMQLDSIGELNGHFVKTSGYKDGLTEGKVAEAIAILNGEKQQKEG